MAQSKYGLENKPFVVPFERIELSSDDAVIDL